MRRNFVKTLLISVVVLSLLVYLAQMFNLMHLQPKKVARVTLDSDRLAGRAEGLLRDDILTTKDSLELTDEESNLEFEMNIYQNDSLSFETRMRNLAKIRRKRVAKKCLSRKLGNNNFDSSDLTALSKNVNILVSDKHKALFCSTGDVNSENWRKLLDEPNGSSDNNNLGIRDLSHYRPESISFRLKYYYKFMVVQEPLVRLISAYKSWILPHPNHEIDERLLYLAKELDSLSHKMRQDFDPESFYNREPNATKYARLSDFASYIINRTTKGQALHPLWERYHVLCKPCVIPYDFVLRPETALDDSRYVISHLQDAEDKSFFTGHMDSSDSELIRELRESIAPETAEKLYEIYRDDYELFGYPKSW